jgi:hypothetical protein
MGHSSNSGGYRGGHGRLAFLGRSGRLGLCISGRGEGWGIIKNDDSTFRLCFLGVGGRLLDLGLCLTVEFTLDSELASYIGIEFEWSVNLRG